MESEPRATSSAHDLSLRWGIPLVTLVVCGVVALRRVPLWVPGQCTWSYQDDPNFAMALAPLGLLATFMLFHAAWLRGAESRSCSAEAAHVLVACALSLLISVSFRLGENFGLARLAILTINPASGGFFQAAYDSRDEPDWLARFPETMKRERHHVAAHPPGNVALMRWWLSCARAHNGLALVADEATSISPGARLTTVAAFCATAWKRPYADTDAAAAFWGGGMLLALAAAVPACVYGAARALFGVSAGIHAASLGAAVPSLILFVPAGDLVYAFVSALSFALAAVGCRRGLTIPLLLCGFLLAVGLAASFAVGAVVVMMTLFLLLQTRAAPLRTRAALVASLWGGLALTLVALRIVGVDWLGVWRTMNFVQAQKIAESNRDYKLWLFFNLADFFTFMGLPVTVLLMIAARRARAEWRDLTAVLAPTAIVIALTDLSGYAPAETARIWMLFIPPLLVATGAATARLAERDANIPRIAFVSQAAQTLVFAVFFNVWTLQ